MPQELRVLQCHQCHTYQVDIVKKTNKWECKLCGQKQSLMRVFATGTAKECRLAVQELNLRLQRKHRDGLLLSEKILNGEIEMPENQMVEDHDEVIASHSGLPSKWQEHCNEEEEIESHKQGPNYSIDTQKIQYNYHPPASVHQPLPLKRKFDAISKGCEQQPSHNTQPNDGLMNFHTMTKTEKKSFKYQKLPKIQYSNNSNKSSVPVTIPEVSVFYDNKASHCQLQSETADSSEILNVSPENKTCESSKWKAYENDKSDDD